MDNYILAYYQKIQDGSEIVGKWIRLLYALIVERIENGTYFYDARKANNAILFIEKFIKHNKGPLAPATLKLSLWQKAAISVIFGVVDPETKLRVFREVFFVVGRKCGKTLLASAIINYMAFCAGEFGSEIYCVATKLDQADLVYSAFEFTATRTPAFSKLIKKRKNDYYISSTNTIIKKLAFADKKSDGYNPQLVICDEIASWPALQGKRQYEVMVSGTGARREPLIVSISSAGFVNEGAYDELYTRSTRFLMGDSKEQRLLPFIYEIDNCDQWDDINELKKSLPGLGTSINTDFILSEINTAHESLSKKSEFLTKYCNKKQNASTAFLSTETVKNASCETVDLEFMRNSYVVAGVDLSQTTDLTAVTLICEKDGVEYVYSHAWLPAGKLEDAITRDRLPYNEFIEKGWLTLCEGSIIDYSLVTQFFINLVQKYEIYPLIVGYDRYSATYFVNEMQANSFKMDDVFQGDNLWGVLQELEAKLKDGKMKIGDNSLLKVHLLSCAIKMSAERGKGRLIKLNPAGVHIDLVAALADALAVKSKYSNEYGHLLKNI